MKRNLFAVLCLLFFLPAMKMNLVTASVTPGQKNPPGTVPGNKAARPPVTIWERMQDPKSWWQGRLQPSPLAKTHPQNARPQLRSFASGAQPHTGGAISNPIFFIPPTFPSGGRFAGNVTIGDFNGDGKADLLLSNQCVSDADCTQSTLAVLLGNGDGTYQTALISPTAAVLSSMTVGDFNGDGKLDVAVGNACPDLGCTTGSVYVLLGNGNGTFRAPVSYSTSGNAFSVEAGDINGDGKLDLIVANNPGSAGVLLGNGDGTFQSVTSFATGVAGRTAVFLGDFNGDRKLDLAVVTADCGSSCNTLVSVLLGNGDGTFQAATASQSFTGLNPQAVALGDADGDGKLDLAVVESCSGDDICGNEIVNVLLGKGDGTFGGAQSSTLGSSDITFISFADLNGDRKPELITVDPDAATAAVLLGAGDGTFSLLGRYESDGTSPLSGALGDLNGDGQTDLAVSNFCQINFQDTCTGNVLVLLGNGSGIFSGPVGLPSNGGNFLVPATADFNNDGRPDLALVGTCFDLDCTGGAVDVLLNGDNGIFQPSSSNESGGFFPASAALGDLNGDGKPDIVVSNQCVRADDCTHGVLGVLLGNGNGTFQPRVTYPVGGNSPTSVAVADLNGDGKLDLAVVSQLNCCLDGSNGSVNVLLGNGDGSFAAGVSYSSGDPFATALAIGDLNGDGKLDLVVANGNCSSNGFETICLTGSVGVLLGNDDGTFQPAVRYSSIDAYAFSVIEGDFNGDGKPDLAMGNNNCDGSSGCGSGSIAVLLGKGDGTFQSATIYAAGDSWPAQSVRPNALAADDLKGDGKLDLVLSSRNVLLGNGDGSFQPAQSYNSTGDAGTSETVADLNGDGKPDLVVSGSVFAAITELLNISTSFQNATSTALASSLNPANLHQRVVFTATVTSTTPGAPSGTITFSDGGHALASVPVAHGKARFPIRSLDAGSHSIIARYDGDQTFLPGTSAPLIQTVRAETRVRLTSSRNPSRRGQAVTFTAVVVSSSGATPTGKVRFRDFSALLGTVELDGGQASITISPRRRGPHIIWADYSGSSTDIRSSAALAQRVR